MKLKNLFTEVDAASAAALEDIQLARTHSYAQRDLPIPPVETRKRFSNIIIVDLIKDNKKLKLPERPPQPVLFINSTLLDLLAQMNPFFFLYLINRPALSSTRAVLPAWK